MTTALFDTTKFNRRSNAPPPIAPNLPSKTTRAIVEYLRTHQSLAINGYYDICDLCDIFEVSPIQIKKAFKHDDRVALRGGQIRLTELHADEIDWGNWHWDVRTGDDGGDRVRLVRHQRINGILNFKEEQECSDPLTLKTWILSTNDVKADYEKRRAKCKGAGRRQELGNAIGSCDEKIAYLEARLAQVAPTPPVREQKKVKCLTIQQPWVWAIFAPGMDKDVENRDWGPYYRGEIYIHAGKTYDKAGEAWIEKKFGVSVPLNLPKKCIFGKVTLEDITEDSNSPWAIAGQKHWLLSSPEKLATPIDCPGKLGLWEAEIDVAPVEDEIREQEPEPLPNQEDEIREQATNIDDLLPTPTPEDWSEYDEYDEPYRDSADKIDVYKGWDIYVTRVDGGIVDVAIFASASTEEIGWELFTESPWAKYDDEEWHRQLAIAKIDSLSLPSPEPEEVREQEPEPLPNFTKWDWKDGKVGRFQRSPKTGLPLLKTWEECTDQEALLDFLNWANKLRADYQTRLDQNPDQSANWLRYIDERDQQIAYLEARLSEVAPVEDEIREQATGYLLNKAFSLYRHWTDEDLKDAIASLQAELDRRRQSKTEPPPKPENPALPPDAPAGAYIEWKVIKGKQYPYLRWRDGTGKLRSKYLKRPKSPVA